MTQARVAKQARGGRDVIVAAAVDNFQRLGYHGTSMRDVARDANITVASIYHHFPSKQLILQDIMKRVLSDAFSATRTALMAAPADPQERLAEIVRAWIRFHTHRRAEALIGASEIRSLDESGRSIVISLRDEQERMFRDVIEHGVSVGAFATPYPAEAAKAILTMGSSVASWYRAGGELSPEELADRYAALALGAVGAS